MIREGWIIRREPYGPCGLGSLRVFADRGWRRLAVAGAVAIGAWLAPMGRASSETLHAALARAYRSNALLNAQRAAALATSENLPLAKSGFLPKVNAVADMGLRRESVAGEASVGRRLENDTTPRNLGLQLSQNLFDGGRTSSAVRQASLEIRAAQQSLRNTEQNTLFDAVVAYV